MSDLLEEIRIFMSERTLQGMFIPIMIAGFLVGVAVGKHIEEQKIESLYIEAQTKVADSWINNCKESIK